MLFRSELSKKKRIVIYILGIGSALTRYLYTYFLSTKEGILNKDLFDYYSFISIFLSVAVFIFVKNINWEKILNKLHINPKILANISSCSFGVYLIHMLIKSKATKFLGLNTYSIWYRTLGAIMLYNLCVLIVYFLKKNSNVKENCTIE